MTNYDLQKGNELQEQIKELNQNIILLRYALHGKKELKGFKKYFLRCSKENEIHIASNSISFDGVLKVDRECMEIIKKYFENKLHTVQAEFENLGK